MISGLETDVLIGKTHKPRQTDAVTAQFTLTFSKEDWKALKKAVKVSKNYDGIAHYFRCELHLNEPEPLIGGFTPHPGSLEPKPCFEEQLLQLTRPISNGDE